MPIPCPLCGRPLTPAPVYRCFYCNNPRAIAHYFDDHENNVAMEDAIRDGTHIGAGVGRSKSTDTMARAVWDACSIDAPEIKAYLKSRAIPPRVPRSLRFHPALAPPSTYQRQPTMVARYANSDAIHRTFLTSRSRGTLGILPERPYIDLTRHMIQDLIEPIELIMGEGIETTLSYNPKHTNVYRYATTTANVRGKTAPIMPESVKKIILLMDNDKAGKMFVDALATHYTPLGYQCQVAAPSGQYNDFSDELQAAK